MKQVQAIFCSILAHLLLLSFCPGDAQQFGASLMSPMRSPAVPLIVVDPYLSVWSNADNLTDAIPVHWSGESFGLYGLISIDGKPFRFMGLPSLENHTIPPIQQISVVVQPTQTIYLFGYLAVRLQVAFSTSSILDSSAYDLFSRPVTYITFSVWTIDGSSHRVKLYYCNTGETAVKDTTQNVLFYRNSVKVVKPNTGLGYTNKNRNINIKETHDESSLEATLLCVGTKQQNILGTAGDAVKIDWGYFYAAFPQFPSVNVSTSLTSFSNALFAFLIGKSLPPDSTKGPTPASDLNVMASIWDLGTVNSTTQSTYFIVAYDDIYSINYFNYPLQPFWRRNGTDAVEMLRLSILDYSSMLDRLDSFDNDLIHKLYNVGGPYYATICSLAYRQITGAMKLTTNPFSQNEEDNVWFFMKEISSDGDVSTVDVLYPASPMLLLLSPESLRLLLMPILAYANNETGIDYNLNWAPHHLGPWPICNISPENQEQMPMEESANMLLMLSAIALRQGSQSLGYLTPYWGLLETWAEYLNSTLPDPPKQTCTDDFEGPSAHNVNLAMKGVLGLAAYAQLLQLKHDYVSSNKFFSLALQLAKQVDEKAHTFNISTGLQHYKREYNTDSSWSLKYNLLYQKFLNLQIFPEQVVKIELEFYMNEMEKYGVPLDERNDFTLLEYMGGLIGLTDDKVQQKMLIQNVFAFLNDTPQRVPMTDWYMAKTAQQKGFQARPVVGDLFSLLLVSSPAQSMPHTIVTIQ